LIDLHTSSETLRQILNINIETGVQVDVTIHNG
jgi:ribosomal protein S10